MMESKLVALICIYRLINYDRGYLGVRKMVADPPPDIYRIVTPDFLSPPHFRTPTAPSLSHPPRRISRGRRKTCGDPPFPKHL